MTIKSTTRMLPEANSEESSQAETSTGCCSKPSFIAQMQKHKTRTVKTLCLYLAYTALGMATGMSGPTILDLQLTVGSTFEEITYILPGRSLGYAMGSFIVGLSYAFINTQLLISICCGLSAVFLVWLPFNRALYYLIATFFANGLVNGMLDTASNMFLLVIWGKENAPFMQALHFAFGMGALYAPLIAKPFLVPHYVPVIENVFENETLDFYPEILEVNETSLPPGMMKPTVDDVQLEIPYGINGVFMLINSIIFMILFTKVRITKPHPSRVMASVLEKMGGGFKERKNVKRVIIVCATLFMHVYCGLELAFGTLITSYAVKSDLHLDKQTGAIMSSVYWGFFTFFRLFAIFFSDIISPERNIFLNLGLIGISNIFCISLFFTPNVYCLWAAICLMGLGTSSIWASVFGFLENFFPVTSGITASFSVAACLGQSIMPFVVGYYIEANPNIFLWVTMVTSSLLLILFSTYSYLCKHKLKGHSIKG